MDVTEEQGVNDLSLWAGASQIPFSAHLELPGSIGSTKYWLSRSGSFWITYQIYFYSIRSSKLSTANPDSSLSFQIEASWQETHLICIGLYNLAYTFKTCYTLGELRLSHVGHSRSIHEFNIVMA